MMSMAFRSQPPCPLPFLYDAPASSWGGRGLWVYLLRAWRRPESSARRLNLPAGHDQQQIVSFDWFGLVCTFSDSIRRVTQARLTRLEAQMETLLGAVNALTERVGKTQPEGTSRAQYSHHAPPAAAPSVKVGVDAQEHGGGGGGGTGWWLTILAVHEAWLLMQHANVLCNPFLQRMDRKYGISLCAYPIPRGSPMEFAQN